MEIVSCGYKSVVTKVTNNVHDGPVQGVNNFVSNRIFLSGFDDQTTEYEIKKAFAEFGTITQTKLMKPPGKRSYGFLTFRDASSCERVLKLKDEMLFCIRGRDVQICPAWYKPKKSWPTFKNTDVTPGCDASGKKTKIMLQLFLVELKLFHKTFCFLFNT
ncbi:protein boule-like [Ciona intestinalis]